MVTLQGECNSCSRGIPYGYIPVVTEWRSVRWAPTLAVMVPKTLYCRPCGDGIEGERRARRRRIEEQVIEIVESKELTAKEVAVALFRVMTKETPVPSKKLAELADLEYSDDIKEILRALRAAGKVGFKDGGWYRK